MYLSHHFDSVTHEQRDNEEVYHYGLYVAFLLYLCLENNQSMKNCYQVQTRVISYTNLNKAISTQVTS